MFSLQRRKFITLSGKIDGVSEINVLNIETMSNHDLQKSRGSLAKTPSTFHMINNKYFV